MEEGARQEGETAVSHSQKRLSAVRVCGALGAWKGEEPPIDSCTIVTTDANDVLKPLHDRMPVILEPNDYKKWIDCGPKDPGILQELLQPSPANDLIAVPVGTQVNNSRNESPDCLSLSSNAEGAAKAE